MKMARAAGRAAARRTCVRLLRSPQGAKYEDLAQLVGIEREAEVGAHVILLH
jgi:hypothetical protein